MSTFIPTLAEKPDNYSSGGKQPVQILTADVTQPRLEKRLRRLTQVFSTTVKHKIM